MPDSVQAILAARIDLLGANEKAGLQAASVIGRIFWRGPVCELLHDVEPDCAILEDRDFIRRRPGSSMAGEIEYAFKHQLTREVAYASLTKAKRARLHAAFAGWLERFGEGRDEHAPLLAHHYAAAVLPADADLAWAGEEAECERLRVEAVAWLRRAAELATGRYDIDEALALFHRALELEPEEAARSGLWREIGRANALKFDGEAFWTAMQESLRLCPDRATCAETYSELAFHTSIRSGMWKRHPEPELVEGWIERALELAEPESRGQARALAARAFSRPRAGEAAAREASALAERLGDLELRSYAWAARSAVAFEQRRFSEAATWAERRFELLGQISDPDHICEVYECAVPAAAALGRLREARRLAAEHVKCARALSPHHRVHGVALTVDVEELAGSWEGLRELTPHVENTVVANLATPCLRNPRTLLQCAIASAYAGEAARERELEQAADECGMEDRGFFLAGPRVRLALVRNDLDAVARMLGPEPSFRHAAGPAPLAARLDGLTALRDRGRVELEAPPLLRAGTYLEPFALRALGLVREDEELIERALARFEALGLDWFAAETRKLVEQA